MGTHHGNGVAKLKTVSPPTSSPAEVIRISPENLEIANCYLQNQDITVTANKMGIPCDLVSDALSKREVKAYIDNVFMDVGFNNRFRMRGVMDEIIKRKLQEMDENDIGSEKDIVEILALSHKMTMEMLDKQIKLIEAQNKQTSIKNQTNVQINSGGGSNYDLLLDKLLSK